MVDPALHVALSNRGAANPQKLGAAITVVRLAHDQMAAVTPPAEVADLHEKAVAVLSSMIRDMTKLGDAETNNAKSAVGSAVTALLGDARQMETLGNQFTSRGY